ncbi:MAG TPA: lamin tail domain-containing protein [Bacteroidales bacterium]|nr:lamin tail domain-containing protein [Bacteroidales bacterium]
MKKVILFIMFMPYLASSQVNIDFESGIPSTWIQVPAQRWKADNVQPINGNNSLHHAYDNTENGIDIISKELTDFHPAEGKSTWSFKIRHGYDPSSTNNWAVYLVAETGSNIQNGFAIGVNLTGSDDSLRLYMIKDGNISIVCRTDVNWQTDVGTSTFAEIAVERTVTGLWEVTVKDRTGHLLSSTQGFVNYIFSKYYFAVQYRYTSTKDQLLWIDDIIIGGTFYHDERPPEITGCLLVSKKSVRLTFDEEPVTGSIKKENFILMPGNVNPSGIIRHDPLNYSLIFRNDFENKKENVLTAGNICDKTGNCKETQSLTFIPSWPEPGDIVISEIMADPSPVVSLPDADYIEITNRSVFSFNLDKWQLIVSGRAYLFPDKDINPGEILILCDNSDVPVFTKYGKIAAFSSFPSLRDDGDQVCIIDSTSVLISGIEYSSGWYGDVLKMKGGWSLEARSLDYPFSDDGNWMASMSMKGGTPGAKNSVPDDYKDDFFYGVNNVYSIDSITIFIRFQEPLIDLEFHPELIRIDGKEIVKIEHADILRKTFIATLKSPLEDGQEYTFRLFSSATDFAGNIPSRTAFDFGVTENAEKGDILFNELLFNPVADDPDYIEFINVSSKIFDASRLQVISISEDSDTSLLYRLSEEKRCILPGCYYVITQSKQKLLNRYFSSDINCIFEASLPSMPDNSGHLVLLNRELQKIDEAIYSDKMHSRLLSGHEGISLEKANPDLASGDAASWHSAAESSGWGTPGLPNSVFSAVPDSEETVAFSSSAISPDFDGQDDILVIRINLTGTNNVISINVYDETGNLIRKLASNIYTGPEFITNWDGTSADGSPVRRGIYIIHITMYNETGKTQQWKKVCTVLR